MKLTQHCLMKARGHHLSILKLKGISLMAKDLLDLHGYKSDEVESALDNFLMQVSKSNLQKARIMTGKGTGTVKSITMKYLKLAGYSWVYEKLSNGKNNEGCLVIQLE